MDTVPTFRFLGIRTSEGLTVQKTHRWLFLLQTLKNARLPQQMLMTFYRCTTESVLTYCISVWYLSCTAADRKALRRVISSAQEIVGIELPALEDIYSSCCLRKLNTCMDPHTHAIIGLNSFHLADVIRTSMTAPPD